MNHKEHKGHKEKFTVSNDSVITSLRHCEERLSGETEANKVITVSISNKRRGNLPSLITSKESLSILKKITSLQTQRNEIASRIQQRQLSLFLYSIHTTARNDE